ncbi:uncharacterized protein BP01DRAFT_390011 [Aspergillus saccharolyticus JOP 1030-1]|uniref:Ribonuclease H-like protein n=1 Tax=Aspergillus saccharolyticus JOP 1030-1 TaxID=1450539 RepID=A0A318ZSY1_9EURO|nr:ribonuclease H-like protein [Aspergillus saccharolyticus JOP 1030-1]PYH47473.1 ribonuclease H-like protein [Aspergillus saccharolyticus JOP 1030-1]
MRTPTTTIASTAAAAAAAAAGAISTSLHTLKATQLQRLAQRTGIKTGGRKPVLIRRLETELLQCEFRRPCHVGSGSGSGSEREQESPQTTPTPLHPGPSMSILSIDMGIRNLAFAHLLVAPPPGSSSVDADGKSKDPSQGTHEDSAAAAAAPPSPLQSNLPTLTLNAWRRLSISDLDKQAEATEAATTTTTTTTEIGATAEAAEAAAAAAAAEEEDFSPTRHAHHAYTLLTTLLARYRPTHVLIERQRFRTGGSSAVQEWTIRVGVFEGMLHAVLYALRREWEGLLVGPGRRTAGGALPPPPPGVWGVEPGRVSRYCVDKALEWKFGDDGVGLLWGDGVRGANEQGDDGLGSLEGQQGQAQRQGQVEDLEIVESKRSSKKQTQKKQTQEELPVAAAEEPSFSTEPKKRKKSTREVKNMKMDLVGNWLRNATGPDNPQPGHLAVADHQELHQWVEAYRTQWEKKKTKSKKTKTEAEWLDIGKLDDLADCLVQGVTWLEWQVMRDHCIHHPTQLAEISLQLPARTRL